MIFASNFKTNHTRKSTRDYLYKLQELTIKNNLFSEVYIFPPSTALDNFENIAFNIGTQNAYTTKNGAFTGEIGLEQLEEFDIKTILIGHSERREKLYETQDIVSSKFQFFKNQEFDIIYCVGESIEIREKGEDAVIEHLLAQFDGIDTTYEKLTIAYEPIWAIGTGKVASIEDITNIHKALKKIASKPILYGGSVNTENIADITNIDSVDGVLVGSASLNADNFCEIIKNGLK
jgi:triosephosphate isomerase